MTALSVYDAFRTAGIADDAARRIAEAITEHSDDGLDKIEARLITVESRLNKVEARTEMVLWMQGVTMALMLLTLGSVFATLWRLAP